MSKITYVITKMNKDSMGMFGKYKWEVSNGVPHQSGWTRTFRKAKRKVHKAGAYIVNDPEVVEKGTL